MVEDVRNLITDWTDEMSFNFVNKFPDNFLSSNRQVSFFFNIHSVLQEGRTPRLSAPLKNCVATDLVCYILSFLVKRLVEHLAKRHRLDQLLRFVVLSQLSLWVIYSMEHAKSWLIW